MRPTRLAPHNPPHQNLSALWCAEKQRLETNGRLESATQSRWSQYFTGAKLASWMASWFDAPSFHLRLLDAGAGVGSLSAAFISEMCARAHLPSATRPRELDIVAYEVDADLLPALRRTLEAGEAECEAAGISLRFEVVNSDFIEAGCAALTTGLFSESSPLHGGFNCAFLNPPYQKIGAKSPARRALSQVGIETGNLYSAFVWLAMRLLEPGGELIAITPRSFCNGPYFKPFRLALRDTTQFRRFHVFESRREAFKEGDVLQENIIFHTLKRVAPRNRYAPNADPILLSTGPHPEDGTVHQQMVPMTDVLRPQNPDAFFYLGTQDLRQGMATEKPTGLNSGLLELGLSVSTGRVVAFRVKESLRAFPNIDSDEDTAHHLAPLIYPLHFHGRGIAWSRKEARKPNALVRSQSTESLLCEPGIYVLVKRLSSKEQSKRLVAVVFDSQALGALWQNARVGFENHLNYFHRGGAGLGRVLAEGLAAFLNSTFADNCFRAFNGHTQVNATDLRSLSYPSTGELEALGAAILKSSNRDSAPFDVLSQEQLDALVESLVSL